MSLYRARGCGCYWRGSSYNQRPCKKHNNESYRPQGGEFSLTLLRGGAVATSKALAVLAVCALGAAVVATPIWGLVFAGYVTAAFWVGMVYIAAAVTAGVCWLVGLLLYTSP